jgi:hypothetical protein
MIKCFWENLEFFFRYQQMVLRLIWRAGLSADFAKVMAIKGQIRRSEARCLYELAQEASGKGVIVEIGSYRGLSTAALARGSLQGPRIPIYSIDPHEAGPRSNYGPQDNVPFFRNLLISGVAEMVRPISLLSSEAVRGWNKPVSLLWIDGNHQYEVVKRDFIEWSGFLIQGGYLAFHDSLDPGGGPYQVVQEALQEGTFELVKRAEKVSVLKKGKHG